MATHINDCFGWFLTSSVNLNRDRLNTLTGRLDAVRTYLTGAGGFALDVVPQGSFPQRTIIRPQSESPEFDADALVCMSHTLGRPPSEYYEQLYDAMSRHSIYGSKLDKRRKHCVRIRFAREFSIDLVPYVVIRGVPHVIDRSAGPDGTFIPSNPLGFTEWVHAQNDVARGHLIPAVRLFKYLRDTQPTYEISSIILTTLLGERISRDTEQVDEGFFADLPTAFANLAAELNGHLRRHDAMPLIEDPSIPGDWFNHRWTEPKYKVYRSAMLPVLDQIAAAHAQTDPQQKFEQWREVFGDRFVMPRAEDAIALSNREASRADFEEFPDERFAIAPRPEMLRIETEVTRSDSSLRDTLRRRNHRAPRGHKLRFQASVPATVRGDYDVYWKVRNTGAEALTARQLRGQIKYEGGLQPLTHTESTRFAGPHYVEVYVVQNDEVVAWGREPVIVEA